LEGHVIAVPQFLMLGTHVPSPEQYLKPLGQDAILGQLLIDFLQELSLEHLTGLSAGQYEIEGQSSRLALHVPSEKQ
jgi:hypothetical protein